MSLPNPLPDNPLRWDGWKLYNSANFYERLGLSLDSNASNVKLAVNKQGEALITYSANGRQKRVLAWNAVDAKPPVQGTKQVEFTLDYTVPWPPYKLAFTKINVGSWGAVGNEIYVDDFSATIR